MHLFCIECLPQNFTSDDQTENYVLDDSVAYGEKIRGPSATSKTSAQLTILCVGTQMKVKQKFELYPSKQGFPSIYILQMSVLIRRDCHMKRTEVLIGSFEENP